MADSDFISIGDDDVDLPTKRSIQEDDLNLDFRNISVNNSHRLLLTNDAGRAGIRYLSPDILVWLPIKLTDVLQANVCVDHEEYWWFTHDFARAHSEKFELFPEDLLDNLELLIRLVLCRPVMGISARSREINEILHQSKTLASYLAYPTLEGFVKIGCRHDIRLDGEIREGRRIRKLTPKGVWKFKRHDDGDGICSNLGMLLWHLESVVSRPEYAVLYREMRQATAEIFGHSEAEVYGLFNDFRNDSLHGRNTARREYGVLLNYISLVIWTTLLN